MIKPIQQNTKMNYKINAKKIHQHANAFYLASERNLEERPNGDGTVQVLSIPGIVNCAFACELYLKSLLMVHGYQSRGHSIESLFRKLPDEIISQIIKEIEGYKFENCLSNISNTFVDWRYSYEKESTLITFQTFLLKLTESLKTHSAIRLSE